MVVALAACKADRAPPKARMPVDAAPAAVVVDARPRDPQLAPAVDALASGDDAKIRASLDALDAAVAEPSWLLVARAGVVVGGPAWDRIVAWARHHDPVTRLASLAITAHRARQPDVARALIDDAAQLAAELPRTGDQVDATIDALQSLADAEVELGDTRGSAIHAAAAMALVRRFEPYDRAMWHATDAVLAGMRGDDDALDAAEERALAELSASDDAEDADVRAELALARGLAGTPEGAIETLGALPEATRLEYLDYLSWCYARLGRWDEAAATADAIPDPAARDAARASLAELRR